MSVLSYMLYCLSDYFALLTEKFFKWHLRELSWFVSYNKTKQKNE